MSTYYKFLKSSGKNGRKICSDVGDHTWKVGREYSVKGDVVRCRNGFHASVGPVDALSYVRGDVLALVEASGDCDNDTDKVCYRSMKIIEAYRWSKKDSVAFSIFAAEQVIDIFEANHPEDGRPRKAIEAARAWLNNPSAASAASSAASAAYAAYASSSSYAAYASSSSSAAYAASYASAAYASAAYAAYAASAASAAYAAYAAYSSSSSSYAASAASAAYAAYAAYSSSSSSSAASAASAVRQELKKTLNAWIETHISELEEMS